MPTVNEKMTAIADNIRSYTGGTESLTLDGMAEGVKEVYKAGQESGGGGNYDEGYEAGQRAEYDRFWDIYQDNGNRKHYEGAFMGYGWNEETLKPKYSIKIESTYMMFAYCQYTGDLDDIFINRGLSFEIDINPSNPQGQMFFQTRISTIGTIDLSQITQTSHLTSFFNSTYIVTIKNLIPPQAAMAATCWQSRLVNLGIGGEITKDFNLSRCNKLSAVSVRNVMENLADVTGQTVTFSKTAINSAFETSSGAADGSTSKEWASLVASRPDWTITLV